MVILLQVILCCLEIHTKLLVGKIMLCLILGLYKLVSGCDWELSLGLDAGRSTMIIIKPG